MALLYLMDHVAAGMAGNYYVKMVNVSHMYRLAINHI